MGTRKAVVAYSTTGIFVMALIVPQVAFAAWWNPLSWNMWSVFRSAPKTQQIQIGNTQATTTRKTATTTELSETQQLRKEVNDLKKQLNTTTQSTKTKTATIPTQTSFTPITTQAPTAPKVTEENFKEVVISTYKKPSDLLKQAIDQTRNSYIPEINARRAMLVNRISLIRKDPFTNSGDGIALNQMFDLFAQQHELEVNYIDKVLSNIDANLKIMTSYQTWYDSSINSLMVDNKRIVTLTELQGILEQEKNNVDRNYSGIENINKAMSYYYDSVIYQETEYAKAYEIIKSALAKETVSTSIPAPSYQPAPPLRQAPISVTCYSQHGPTGLTVTNCSGF